MNRSYLFIPGNNPAMLQNADVFGADALILDLEDAVSVTEKDAARHLVSLYLSAQITMIPKIYIRINGLDSKEYEQDLMKVVSDHIDGIVLPKARTSGVNLQKTMGIIPIIETAKSVLELEDIARQPRIEGLLLGAEDLASDMEIERTKEGTEIAYVRAKIAYACKAYKLDAIDTPYTDSTDYEGLKADCLRAQNLGFNGKAAIHPNQLETLHEVFSPSQKRIDGALRVLVAAKNAATQGLGVFSLDGKMIDKPIIERAEKLLKQAEKYGLLPVHHD
jgi:citrate lyase subunit beta/citryl-CoA lyase